MKNVLSSSGGGTHRDLAISAVRSLAFMSIILCHIFQYFGIELAWWFNVGVQVFLCMSGFLYGKKKIEGVLYFYKKQLIKILVPYYLVILFMIGVEACFARNQLSIVRIINVVLCHGTLAGGEHLWFIATILFCYLLLPLLNLINSKIDEIQNIYKKAIAFCIVFAGLSLFVRLFVNYFNAAWIACFYLGTVLGKNDNKNKQIKEMLFLTPSTLILVGTQIVLNYVIKIDGLGSLYKVFCDYGHTFLGATLLIALLMFFRTVNMPKIVKSIVAFLDSVSYEGYLVHQFFILGPLTVFNRMNSIPNAIIMIIIMTFTGGLIIKVLAQRIQNAILR